MPVRCPDGHESTATDYCDVCGAPIVAAPATPGPPPAPAPSPPSAPSPTSAPASKACPSCQAANLADALFCESCGYDFTTGQLPPPAGAPPAPPPSAVTWVAEIWVDPGWYERNRDDATEPCPSAGEPKVVPLAGTRALIGRPSASLQVRPQVDCTPDSGVSRKHAQLLLDGERWYVEDLGSTNGTYVATATANPPADPIPSGQRRELSENDRVYLGAWTRIVVRRASSTERRN